MNFFIAQPRKLGYTLFFPFVSVFFFIERNFVCLHYLEFYLFIYFLVFLYTFLFIYLFLFIY